MNSLTKSGTTRQAVRPLRWCSAATDRVFPVGAGTAVHSNWPARRRWSTAAVSNIASVHFTCRQG